MNAPRPTLAFPKCGVKYGVSKGRPDAYARCDGAGCIPGGVKGRKGWEGVAPVPDAEKWDGLETLLRKKEKVRFETATKEVSDAIMKI